MKRILIRSAMTAALSLAVSLAFAIDPEEPIYGSQIMTQQERAEHRAQMRAAKTAEERERIRQEHHERMKERAQAQGMALPDEPPAERRRMAPQGGGMGPGGGHGR